MNTFGMVEIDDDATVSDAVTVILAAIAIGLAAFNHFSGGGGH